MSSAFYACDKEDYCPQYNLKEWFSIKIFKKKIRKRMHCTCKRIVHWSKPFPAHGFWWVLSWVSLFFPGPCLELITCRINFTGWWRGRRDAGEDCSVSWLEIAFCLHILLFIAKVNIRRSLKEYTLV